MNKHSKLKQKEWRNVIADQRTKDRSQYPAAPSASRGAMRKYNDLIKKAIAKKKNFRACILGSTPELRDLILKYGGELSCIDISIEMIAKTTPLLKYDNSKETIIKGDWLDNPIADNYFDIVLGDGVSNNIALKDQAKFFKQIKRILKPNGYVILRENGINPDRQRQTVEEINKDYMSGKIHWFDMLFNLYFYSDISSKTFDKKTYKHYMGKLFTEIDKAYKQGHLSKRAYQAMAWFKGNLIHTFMPRPVLEKFIKKEFKILPVKQPVDFQFSKDTFNFFFLKPKK